MKLYMKQYCSEWWTKPHLYSLNLLTTPNIEMRHFFKNSLSFASLLSKGRKCKTVYAKFVIAIIVPVLPTPALQWTTDFIRLSYEDNITSINFSMNTNSFYIGTEWSGQLFHWYWYTMRSNGFSLSSPLEILLLLLLLVISLLFKLILLFIWKSCSWIYLFLFTRKVLLMKFSLLSIFSSSLNTIVNSFIIISSPTLFGQY